MIMEKKILLVGTLEDLATLVDKSSTDGYVIEKSLIDFYI